MKNMIKFLILFIYGFLLTGAASAQMVAHFGQTTGVIQYRDYNSATLHTMRYPFWEFSPTGPRVASRRTCLIIGFAGTSGGAGNQVEDAIMNHGLDLSNVIAPITLDTFQFRLIAIYDSTLNNNPPASAALPGIIRNCFSRYPDTDTTRVYVVGLSAGAGTTLSAVTTIDSVNRYIAAAEACSYIYSLGFDWFTPGYYSLPSNPIGTVATLNNTHTAIWQTHGISDATLPYAQATRLRDSMSAHLPLTQLYHFTTLTESFRNGHFGFYYQALDTFPIEPGFWNWDDHSTLGAGGRNRVGTLYSWLLLYRNSLTPGGNAANLTAMSRVSQSPIGVYLPVITGSVDFSWLHDNTYSLSFRAYDSSEDREYDAQESEDGINWKTVRRIPADGDRDYQQTFEL